MWVRVNGHAVRVLHRLDVEIEPDPGEVLDAIEVRVVGDAIRIANPSGPGMKIDYSAIPVGSVWLDIRGSESGIVTVGPDDPDEPFVVTVT